MLQRAAASAYLPAGIPFSAHSVAAPALAALTASHNAAWRIGGTWREHLGMGRRAAAPTHCHASTLAAGNPADHDHADHPAAGEAVANKDSPTPTGQVEPHPGMHKAPWGTDINVPTDVAAVMRNPVYTREYMEFIKPQHLPPKELHQRLAFKTIAAMRKTFDLATGYSPEHMNEARWLRRIIFLETTAGVPGMVGGMLRHLRSLRLMRRDNGWINTLLEEAENERMHLLTFLEMRQPGRMFRAAVLAAQGIMFNMLFVAYVLSPKYVHSLVGYLEEEAVLTYTHAIKDIDAGRLWPNTPAPPIAQAYWRLPADATMRDLILAVRADEACHSHVNHTFAAMDQDEVNPFTGKDSSVMP